MDWFRCCIKIQKYESANKDVSITTTSIQCLGAVLYKLAVVP